MIKESALMTLFRLTPPHALFFFLMVSGVVSRWGWSVDYKPSSICALNGSTVNFGCSYTYPYYDTFSKAFWTKDLLTKDREPSDLSLDPNYTGRYRYLGDRKHNCNLSLTDVTEQDRGTYYFRFLTTSLSGKFQGINGVKLSVTELRVELISDRVVEGDEVTLTCKNTCRLPASTFKWYKQGHLFFSIPVSNLLTLLSVSQKDAGSYSCSIDDYHSPAFTLDVQYSPKNVSVSISRSDEILKGNVMNLTCSSDANPPAHSYTWYKMNESSPVGSGQSYSFTLSSSSSGWFYCEAQNKFGSQRSAAVPLTLNEGRNVVLYVILGVITVCGALIAIVVVLFIRKKRRSTSTDYVTSGQENTNTPTSHAAVVNQDDVQYASIQHRTAKSLVIQALDSGAADEVEYATVQHDRVVKQTQEYDDLYANVGLNHGAAAYRSAAPASDVSVIYN